MPTSVLIGADGKDTDGAQRVQGGQRELEKQIKLAESQD